MEAPLPPLYSLQRPDVDSKQSEDAPPVKIQTEIVDVYLLAPEEDREIELKDFTIMKPKNNKMHRLIRYYPRCEISYRASPPPPPPEEKIVTSPSGTTTIMTTTTHRHNGGFSNPSRNAEVFRLKRKLLKEYFHSLKDQETAIYDNLQDNRIQHNGGDKSYHHYESGPSYNYHRRVISPRSPVPPPPKYVPIQVGDEDTTPLTSEQNMTLKERVQYVTSLWPGIAPMDDDEVVMDYYGLEVEVISEEERKKELDAAAVESGTTSEQAALPDTGVKSEISNGTTDDAATSPVKDDGSASPEVPEMTVETRSATLQRIKDAEGEKQLKTSPISSKQDDWVQCDKCQKWRRLPNHVNVSELPATWYCKMNRWDKRHNKCSIPEEKPVVLMKESDLVEYRERKFVQEFLQRMKRMEKAVQQFKYTDMRDDDGERKVVQCVECLKLRPLIGGMDPSKITHPFVCWMNWDELCASCSVPQGDLPDRNVEIVNASSVSGSGAHNTHAAGDDAADKSYKRSSSINSDSQPNGSSEASKKPSKTNVKKVVKRKIPPSSTATPERIPMTTSTTSNSSSSNASTNAKRAKRR